MDLYYHIRSPPCQPVVFLAKHMGLEFNHKITSIYDPVDFEALKKVNPRHTIPTLVDTDGQMTVCESHAILIYLAEKYALDDSLYPKDLAERTVVNQRLFFDSGVLQGSSMAIGRFHLCSLPVPEEDAAKLNRALGVLEMFLTGHSYVAGEKLTIADFSIFVGISSLVAVEHDLTPYPNIVRWFETMRTHIPDVDALRQQAVTELKELLVSRMK